MAAAPERERHAEQRPPEQHRDRAQQRAPSKKSTLRTRSTPAPGGRRPPTVPQKPGSSGRAKAPPAAGWASKLGTPAFTGKDSAGVFHFPGFSADAVDELIKGRRAAAIGVDTLSLDNGPSTTFAAHVKWLGADKYGVECMKNLDKIPATGATATVGVIPWQQGSGGPARVLATY